MTGRRQSVHEVAQQQVEANWITPVGRVARSLEHDKLTAERRCQPFTAAQSGDVVVAAVHDQARASHLRREVVGSGATGIMVPVVGGAFEVGSALCCDDRLGCGLEPPLDRVLELLGRVRLGEHLAHEELDEAGPVTLPVVPVVLRPTFVSVERLLEAVVDAVRRVSETDRWTDHDGSEHPLGVVDSQLECKAGAHRHTHDHRSVSVRRIEDGHCVLDDLLRGVGGDLHRPVASSVAPAVVRDHPEMPGEVGNLPLPATGVDDCPCRQEQDRGTSTPEHLIADLDSVPLDVSLDVGLHCTHGGPSSLTAQCC